MTEVGFLFVYFTGKGTDGAFLASSENGLDWSRVSEKPIIVPNRGLMRDPFLLRGPDGTFHLLWTTDWESSDIGYSSSEDLIEWTPQRRLPVMGAVPGVRNCWAPEVIYDDATSSFVIYWASTVPGLVAETAAKSEDGYNHRMWRTTTRDFQSFSPPEIFFDQGFNVIDVTLLRDSASGNIRLIGKDESLAPVAKNLFHCEANSPFGPFSPRSAPFTQSWVEGPATAQMDGWTYVYFDQYTSKRYGAVRTRDFTTWEDVSDQLSMPDGARHGSILPLPKAQIASLHSTLAYPL